MMFERLRPLGDRVLVKRLEDQDVTPAGIIIPDAAKEKPQAGKVVAVGKGRRDKDGNCIAMEVSTGDVIYFGKYAGQEAGEFLIVREDEILGVVEK